MTPKLRQFYDCVYCDPQDMDYCSRVGFADQILRTLYFTFFKMNIEAVHSTRRGRMFDIEVRFFFEIKIPFRIIRCPSHPPNLLLVMSKDTPEFGFLDRPVKTSAAS